MVVQDGSAIVAAPAGDRRDLRLYVGGTDGKMKQYPYYIEDTELGSAAGEFFFPRVTILSRGCSNDETSRHGL